MLKPNHIVKVGGEGCGFGHLIVTRASYKM